MTSSSPSATIFGVRDRRDRAAFYLNLSRTGDDIVLYRAGGRPAFLINRPEYAQHVLAHNEGNYKNPYHPYGELVEYYSPAGSALLHLKSLAGGGQKPAECVSTEIIRAASKTAARVKELSKDGPVDVVLEVKRMLLVYTAQVLFGVDTSGLRDDFIAAATLAEECWANQLFTRVSPKPDPLEKGYLHALNVLDNTAAFIARRVNIASNDTDITLSLKNAIIRTLLNGYNALAAALTWAIYQVSQRTELIRKLYLEANHCINEGKLSSLNSARLPHTRSVVLETLRLYPPAWIIRREALSDDTLGRTSIPSGAIVSISPYTMQRRSGLWEHPNEFIADRFITNPMAHKEAYSFFPFGGGARKCPASHLAVGQLQLALATLLLHTCITPIKSIVRPRGLIALHPYPGVWARFTDWRTDMLPPDEGQEDHS